VNRSLTFVVAVTLAAAQPAVTLGAQPGGLALSRTAAPAPRPAVHGGFARANDFKLPFDVDVKPKALAESQRFVLPSTAALHLSRPGHLWYPALYGPACYASTSFAGSPSQQQQQQQFDTTIGSLVDGKSSLLSPPSHAAVSAAPRDPGAVSSSPVTFQAGFYPTACGTQSFTNF
jgi:hypothetical protein